VPACGAAAPVISAARGAVSAFVPLGGQPTEAVAAPDGSYSYVALDGDAGAGLGALGVLLGLRAPASIVVLSGENGGAQPLRTISVPGQPSGLAVTPDGELLLAADGAGVLVLNAAAAASGSGPAVLGELADGGLAADDIAISPDSRYAFVAEAGGVGVYDLSKVTPGSPLPQGAIGRIPLPLQVRGVAISPDGRTLVAVGMPVLGGQGQIAAINALDAESTPGTAPVELAPAGCEPARVAISPDGSTAWATATGSNALLAFNLATLSAGQSGALERVVGVGPSPIGVGLADDGEVAVVADSDLNAAQQEGPSPALTLVDTGAALGGASGLLGDLPTDAQPQDVTSSPDGISMLVADAGASRVQILDSSTLPEGGDGGGAPPVQHMRLSVSPRRVRAGRRTRLRVLVREVGGGAVDGAAIRIGGVLAHTNAAGRADLRVRLRRPERVRLVVSDGGYASAAVTITAVRR
jgi:DNA-binding beta-propeller fold protein YncE